MLPFQSVLLILPWYTVMFQVLKLNVHVFLVILLYTHSKHEFRLLCLMEGSHIIWGGGGAGGDKESLVPLNTSTIIKFQCNKGRGAGGGRQYQDFPMLPIWYPVCSEMKHSYY